MVTGGLAACNPAAEAKAPAGPVVLELFTSEGCSSCPPADALLAELAERPGVVTLELHVDYWDGLGWRDPFSQAAFSERQARYDRQLGRDGVYTPQLVVNGRAEGVGSNRAAVLALLGDGPPAAAPVTLRLVRDGNTLRAQVDAPGATAATELLLGITERGLTTDVQRGENAGRHLAHGAVVRHLERVPPGGELRVPLERGWDPARLEGVALLQDRQTLRILGVARTPL
jgi:hypothetical protein